MERPERAAGISALLFLGALAIMSAIAGWSDVTGRLHLRLSFWFVIAFAAEAAASRGTCSPTVRSPQLKAAPARRS